MRKVKVADLEVCQEFRIGKVWYRALLPPLLSKYPHVVKRWCLNLLTFKTEAIETRKKVDEMR